MLTRPENLPVIRIVLTAIWSVGFLSLRATADEEAAAVWGVNTGDRFLVSVVVVKRTEVTVDDHPPILSETTDQLRIDYRVVQVSTAGDAIVVARMQRADREAGRTSPESLKSTVGAVINLEDVAVVLLVDNEGVVQKVSSADKESILAQVSGFEPAALRLLQHACPEEVISAWFGKPFWIACNPKTAEAGHTWTRQDGIAVGEFGTLRNSNDIRIAHRTDQLTDLEISGAGRYVPLVIPEADAQLRSALLTNVTAELDQISGTARMLQQPADRDPADRQPADREPADQEEPEPAAKRPQFESIELTIRFHGHGTLQSARSAMPQQVSFRQTQSQSWKLVDFEFGDPKFLFHRPAP